MASKRRRQGGQGAKGAAKKSPRRASPALTEAQMRALPRPKSNYEELVDKAAQAWTRSRGKIRPPDLTPAKLASLVKAARRAQDREGKIRAAFAARIKSASDRRLVADAQAWKALLYLWSVVKPLAARYPDVRKDFAFLEQALSPRRRGAPADTPTPQP